MPVAPSVPVRTVQGPLCLIVHIFVYSSVYSFAYSICIFTFLYLLLICLIIYQCNFDLHVFTWLFSYLLCAYLFTYWFKSPSLPPIGVSCSQRRANRPWPWSCPFQDQGQRLEGERVGLKTYGAVLEMGFENLNVVLI